MAHIARSAARIALVLSALAALPADGRSGPPATIGRMAASAARVFRGHCIGISVGEVEVAGARLPATTYTFRVGEHLKGSRRRTITFRQLGTPGGGPRDMTRLAELPTYAPGTEYVLFLLPASAVGLTSPAGAAEGAFVIRDETVQSARGSGHGGGPGRRERASSPAADLETSSYEELRRAVRAAAGP